MIDLILKLITNMVNCGKEHTDKQKSLSNAVQLIHIGNLIHQRGVFDLSIFPDHGNNLRSDDDLILGNKIALLAGDFLLASAQMKITLMRFVNFSFSLNFGSKHSSQVSKKSKNFKNVRILSFFSRILNFNKRSFKKLYFLHFCNYFRDAEILKIISSAMCDIIDYNFVGERDMAGVPLPLAPGKIPKMKAQDFEAALTPVKLEGLNGTAEDEWMIRQTLYRGLLVAKGCRATAVIAKRPANVQKDSFELAKNLFFSWQAFVDLQSFENDKIDNDQKFNLTSAPVLFHLQHKPAAHVAISNHSINLDDVDYQVLFDDIKTGPGVELTKELLKKLVKNARKHLKSFESSEDKTNVEKILDDFK